MFNAVRVRHFENMQYPEPIAKLIDSYTKLPGIGPKTATRLAFYTLGMNEEEQINNLVGLMDGYFLQ